MLLLASNSSSVETSLILRFTLWRESFSSVVEERKTQDPGSASNANLGHPELIPLNLRTKNNLDTSCGDVRGGGRVLDEPAGHAAPGGEEHYAD